MEKDSEDKPVSEPARDRPKCPGTAETFVTSDSRPVLHRRARELARAIAPAEDGEGIEIVEFHLGRERLALETAWVQEVFIPREIVRIPGAPPFIAGLVNLRGIVHSVVDLKQILGFPDTAGERRGVVLLLADDGMEFGLLAERVETARRVLLREIGPPLPTLPEPATRYLRGVLPGAVSLLDAGLLLNSPQMLVNQRENADF